MANAGMGGGQFAAFALNFLGIMNFDKALTMIISAVAAKHAVGAGRCFSKRWGPDMPIQLLHRQPRRGQDCLYDAASA